MKSTYLKKKEPARIILVNFGFMRDAPDFPAFPLHAAAGSLG
jgi:hypothetical protein